MKTPLRYKLTTPYPTNPVRNTITAPTDSKVLTVLEEGRQYVWLLGDESKPESEYHFLTIRGTDLNTPLKPSVPKDYNKYIGTIRFGIHTDHVFQAT